MQALWAVKAHSDSFADLLLQTKDPKTGRLLNDGQLCPEIAGLLFAGVDTTGHTVSFCL